jgi:hypothetical protein
MATETRTDMGIGLAVLCTLLAGAGAIGMYLGAPERPAAWGFGAAMVFGALAVGAIHVYWS